MSVSHFSDFELLVTVPRKSYEVVKILSTDLKHINISSIEESCLEIDDLSSDYDDLLCQLSLLCADKNFLHYNWGLLAGRLKMVYTKRAVNGSFSSLISRARKIYKDDFAEFCIENSERLENMMVPSRDWSLNFFSIETLLKGYLIKFRDDNEDVSILETPQYLYLRIASFLWYSSDDSCFDKIKQTYEDLSNGIISHASPTQFNAGMKRHQLASCFLLDAGDDMTSLSKSWHDSAIISMNNGGIGMSFDSTRHSEIGNNGMSKGIVPWIKIENEVLATVDQGGKRKGSGTMYLRDWHFDIFQFIELKSPEGSDQLRARDLFYAIMVSDEFMRRVKNDENWTLICPNKTNKLYTKWGKEFENDYKSLEKAIDEGKIKHAWKRVKARELWDHILKHQIETGMPFILFIDSINAKSNQQNLGTIRLSNLCTEIVEYVDKNEIASCNLASIKISEFVNDGEFDFNHLENITRRVLRNMKQVIERNYYPKSVPEIKFSNLKNRPIGIGLQDLAGCFAKMDISWDSDKAKKLNEKIARSMYYWAMDENVKMAEEFGSYKSFPGSPASKGKFQYDLWGKREKESNGQVYVCGQEEPCHEFDWKDLRSRMIERGLYFSMIFAQMPTASTAQILNSNESIEPYTNLIFRRSVLSGQFTVIVNHLVDDFVKIGLWNPKTVKNIVENSGSIQNVEYDGEDKSIKFRLGHLKRKYLTAYEMKQTTPAKLYIERARYQCQTTSNNIFMKSPDKEKLNKILFYLWRNGAKTGMYYLKQPALVNPNTFSLDSAMKNMGEISKDQTENCFSCGS